HTRCYRDWSSDVCSSDLVASTAMPLENEYSSGIAVDATGNIALTGNVLNDIDFGCGGLLSNGSRDIFFAKFSSGGSCLWSKRVEIGRASCRESGGRSMGW